MWHIPQPHEARPQLRVARLPASCGTSLKGRGESLEAFATIPTPTLGFGRATPKLSTFTPKGDRFKTSKQGWEKTSSRSI